MVMITSTLDRDTHDRFDPRALSFGDASWDADGASTTAAHDAATARWGGSFGDAYDGSPYGPYGDAATTVVATPAPTPDAVPSRSDIIDTYWQANQGDPHAVILAMATYQVSVAEMAQATGQTVDQVNACLYPVLVGPMPPVADAATTSGATVTAGTSVGTTSVVVGPPAAIPVDPMAINAASFHTQVDALLVSDPTTQTSIWSNPDGAGPVLSLAGGQSWQPSGGGAGGSGITRYDPHTLEQAYVPNLVELDAGPRDMGTGVDPTQLFASLGMQLGRDLTGLEFGAQGFDTGESGRSEGVPVSEAARAAAYARALARGEFDASLPLYVVTGDASDLLGKPDSRMFLSVGYQERNGQMVPVGQALNYRKSAGAENMTAVMAFASFVTMGMTGVFSGAAAAGEAAAGAGFNAAVDSQLANLAIEAGGGSALAGYGGAAFSAAVPTTTAASGLAGLSSQVGSAMGFTGEAAATAGNFVIKVGVQTVANGGDIKGALIGAVGGVVGGFAGDALQALHVPTTLAGVLGGAVGSYAIGQDPLQAALSGAVGAGVNGVSSQLDGFGNLPSVVQNTLTSAASSIVLGQDITAGLISSGLYAGLDAANQGGDAGSSDSGISTTDTTVFADTSATVIVSDGSRLVTYYDGGPVFTVSSFDEATNTWNTTLGGDARDNVQGTGDWPNLDYRNGADLASDLSQLPASTADTSPTFAQIVAAFSQPAFDTSNAAVLADATPMGPWRRDESTMGEIEIRDTGNGHTWEERAVLPLVTVTGTRLIGDARDYTAELYADGAGDVRDTSPAPGLLVDPTTGLASFAYTSRVTQSQGTETGVVHTTDTLTIGSASLDQGIELALTGDASAVAVGGDAANLHTVGRGSADDDIGYRTGSVPGQSYVAQGGDSISSILGTSDPQAVGNFMHANGLTSSTILAGHNYFVPDNIHAYGDSATQGQATLNADNALRSQTGLTNANSNAQSGAAGDADLCTPTNPYGLPTPRTTQELLDLMNRQPLLTTLDRLNGGAQVWTVGPTTSSAMLDEGIQRTVGTVLGVAGLVHGTVQLASDQVWVLGNVLSGGWLADNSSVAQDTVNRNATLGQALTNLPGQVAGVTLRLVSGNWQGMGADIRNALHVDQINALNASGDYLGAQVLFTQGALNVTGVVAGGAGIVRSGLWTLGTDGTVTMGLQLAAEDFAGSSFGQRVGWQLEQHVYRLGGLIYAVTSDGMANAAAGIELRTDLSFRARILPDTSNDTRYIAQTDQAVLRDNNFDMEHVLSGEVNTKGKATGYHAEFAAEGSARIKDGATVTFNPNGTYEAPVQIWDSAKALWVDKPRESTFLPLDWSEARIAYEVTEAYKVKLSNPAGGWTGTTPSGIEVQFFWDPKNKRTTFYPIGNP